MTKLDRQLSLNAGVLSTTLGRSEGGSAPTESRPLDRLDLALEGSGPMHIVPAAHSRSTPPPEIALGRVDACPECVLNTEAPRDAKATATGYIASYLCTDCGHAWLTSWKD